MIGYNDEIIDSTFLSNLNRKDTILSLATNSSSIRLYSLDDLDCRLLSGHNDIVLCVKASASGDLLGSGSKDNTARLWRSSSENQLDWFPLAICEGHTESIGSIAFPCTQKMYKDIYYIFTGSRDRTIKMWDTSPLMSEVERLSPKRLKALSTIKAHEKDINSLDVSPDDLLLASGSQDKTAKLFHIHHTKSKSGSGGELKLLGVLKGHKRGIWDVKFHPSEKMLATASGDKTIKIWSIAELTCLKTLEEHTNSVLRINFLSRGIQLASSASDGLVKLWNLDEERCIATLDNHEDKVWALCISTDEKKIVSGAGDSIVTIWEDVTEQKARERENERTALVLKEQSFNNFLAVDDYQNAFLLALAMNQPGRLLKLFQSVALISGSAPANGSITGNPKVDEILTSLTPEDLGKLLQHVRSWNATSKTSGIAQQVLYAVLKLRHHDDLNNVNNVGKFLDGADSLLGKPRGIPGEPDLIESLIPYTERHLHRLDRLVQESYVIDLIIGEMDDGLIDIDQDDI